MVVYDSSGLSHNAFALPDRQVIVQRDHAIPFIVQNLPSADILVSGAVDVFVDHFAELRCRRVAYNLPDELIIIFLLLHIFPRKEPGLSGAATPDAGYGL